MSDALPTGWISARIADVTEPVPNAKPEDLPEHEFGYVDISAIDNSSFSITEVKWFAGKDAPSRARRPIRPDDVLFSNVRTYLRNVALVSRDCPARLCSTGFTVLRPNAAVEPRYLFRYVLTNDFVDGVTPQQTGTHYPATSDRVVMTERIALPPLDEQRRIVAKLEKLLTKVASSQQRLAKIPVLLKRFRQSVLAAACSGRLTADWRNERSFDDEWPVAPLSEFFVMRNGKSLIATKRRDGDVPVYGGNGHVGTHKEANADGLVIVIGRVGAQCGNVHYVTGKVWVTDNAISLQGKKELFPAFYAFFLRSLNLNQLSAGTGQPYVSQEILGPIETPVVSLPEQHEIVRRVEGLFGLADQLELRLAKARGHVDQLTASLLARAFAGQLVPQDPNDEPASALLDRIKENNQSSSTKQRPKRPTFARGRGLTQ